MTIVLAGFGALVIATFLQLAVPGDVLVWGLEPDLVLALVVAWAWVCGPRWAFCWALLGGLLLDLAGGGPVGVHALSLLVAGYAVGVLRSVAGARGWALTVPAGAVGGALYGVIILLAQHLLSEVPPTWGPALAQLVGAVLSGGILSVPFALLLFALRRTLAVQRDG